MFLPLGDAPKPRQFLPFVNWALIAANVAVFLFIAVPLSSKPPDLNDPELLDYIRLLAPSLPSRISALEVLQRVNAYDLFTFKYGYKPGGAELTDLFTSMFLHGGLAHLGGNMLFLGIFGTNAEYRMGRIGYLATYLGTGIVATLTFALFARGSMAPMIGASGAISGVLGIYFVLFPRNRVKVFIFLFPIFLNVIYLPARWVLGAYVLLDNLLPLLLGSQSGVAYGAHLGGFVGGLLIAGGGRALSWRLPGRRTREMGPMGGESAESYRAARGPAHSSEALREAIASGDRDGALRALAREGVRLADDLPTAEGAALAEWLAEAGYQGSATRLLRLMMHRAKSDRDLARITLALGLTQLGRGEVTPAYQYLARVFDLDPDPETAERARSALLSMGLDRRLLKL